MLAHCRNAVLSLMIELQLAHSMMSHQYRQNYGTLEMTVGDFTVEGSIQLPQQLRNMLNTNQLNVAEIVIPIGEVDDEQVWEGSGSGTVTVKEAYEFYQEKYTKVVWYYKV